MSVTDDGIFYTGRTVEACISHFLKFRIINNRIHSSIYRHAITHNSKLLIKVLTRLSIGLLVKFKKCERSKALIIIRDATVYATSIKYAKKIYEIWKSVIDFYHTNNRIIASGFIADCYFGRRNVNINIKISTIKWMINKTIEDMKMRNNNTNDVIREILSYIIDNPKIATYVVRKFPYIVEYLNVLSVVYYDRQASYTTARSHIKVSNDKHGNVIIVNTNRNAQYDLFNIITRRFTSKNLTKLISYYLFVM